MDGDDQHEAGYIEGRRRTLLNLLRHTLNELHGFADAEDRALLDLGRYVAHRGETETALKTLCRDLGISSDWPEGLHQADIVNKYLAPHVVRK